MRGIMFLSEMYAASEAGNKCMTSRMGGKLLDAVNRFPDLHSTPTTNVSPDGIVTFLFNNPGMTFPWQVGARYKVGEILYVKEPWGTLTRKNNNGIIVAVGEHCISEPDLNIRRNIAHPYRNKMFMPASAARRWIRIIAIECKRVQDMNTSDYIREGIVAMDNIHVGIEGIDKLFLSYSDAWEFIINKVKKGTYTLNPWTFRYRYEWLRSLPVTPEYEVSMIVSPVK